MTGEVAHKQYRYGRVKSGGTPALRVAVPVGMGIAVVLGVTKVVLGNPDGPFAWVAGLILGTCLAPFAVALVWTVIVDRSTLPGAVARPEESVEHTWYTKATSDAFHVVLVVCGVGASLAGLWVESVVSWTLIAVFVVAAMAFGVSYTLRRR